MSRPRAMERSLTLLVCLLAGCTDAAPESSDTGALALGEAVHERLAGIDDLGAPWVEVPSALAEWRDSIVVADPWAGRIHMLSRSLEGGRSFGVEGEGPGELQRPSGVHPLGDTLAVYDAAHRRITWFDAAGAGGFQTQVFIQSLNPGFSIGADREVWYPVLDSTWYALAARGDNSRPVIARPMGLDHGASLSTGSQIVPHASGPILIDFRHPRVIFAGSEHDISTTPPPGVLEQLVARAAELSAPPEQIAFPIFKAGPATDGVVLWFPFESGVVGAVVTTDGRWTMIHAEAGQVTEYPSSILLVDRLLYVATSDGIRAFPLEPTDP